MSDYSSLAGPNQEVVVGFRDDGSGIVARKGYRRGYQEHMPSVRKIKGAVYSDGGVRRASQSELEYINRIGLSAIAGLALDDLGVPS